MSADLTVILRRMRAGDPQAAHDAYLLLEKQLRQSAHFQLKGSSRPDFLSTTALVDDAFHRLLRNSDSDIESRIHFVGMAAKAMRHIVIDHFRSATRSKRAAAGERIPLDNILDQFTNNAIDLLDLEAALIELETYDSELSRIVELRFFAGRTMPEIAAFLGIGLATAERRWAMARTWLGNRIR